MPTDEMWESYLSDPTTEPADRLRTLVFQPIR